MTFENVFVGVRRRACALVAIEESFRRHNDRCTA